MTSGDMCQGLMGRLFGHKFVQRMHTTEETAGKWPFTEGTIESQIAATNVAGMSDLVQATSARKTTYVHDICVRCGKIIKQDNSKVGQL